MFVRKMDLSRLPVVLIEEIERFVQPWRTYKKEEADLITWHCMWLEYEIREKNLYFPQVKDWSIYAQMWLLKHGCDYVSRYSAYVRLERLGSPEEDIYRLYR
jgi:hypothetical protein